MIRQKDIVLKIFLSLLLFLGVAVLSGMLITGAQAKNEPELMENLDAFRAFAIDHSYLKGASSWEDKQYRQLVTSFLYNKSDLSHSVKECSERGWYSLLLPERIRKDYQDAFYMALSDGRYFPVAEDAEGGAVISYEDSWGGARTYGGDRKHEGTDLIPSVKQRGYLAVISVSDGVVEKKGWLTLGGYRLGIRAPHGAYYYYAHLDHYAENIDEGSNIKAGDVIGYMGDSGYGDEGTVGQFEVHLHFGIYLKLAEKEISINPYPILKSLEGKRMEMRDRTQGEERVI